MKKKDLKPGGNKVYFQSDGKRLAALVYLPTDYKEGEKWNYPKN